LLDAFDVILPTHDRPHTLPWAIRSVLHQTHGAFTLHVIGDGCGDDTEAVVRGFDDSRVRFHRFPKAHGFGYAHRNRVLAAADAPYVAYMTDDDLWFPDHLERGLRGLTQGRLDLVAFRSVLVRPPDTFDPYFFAFDWRIGWPGRWLRNWFMGAVSCVHRRAVFDSVGYWNEELSRFGDREFYNRLRISSRPSAYLDHPTVLRFYAQHWDAVYARAVEPPQQKFLSATQDEAWRRSVYAALRPGGRSPRVRAAQWRDFFAFGFHSGFRFLRFGIEQRRSRARMHR
jgi:glycosyltransferase involved in cell wall biosynthesis